MHTIEYGNEMIHSLLREKGNVCISIIIPTHRLAPDRRVDRLHVETAIRDVEEYLRNNLPEDIFDTLMTSVAEMYRMINFDHNSEGIGIFVSKNIKKLIHFIFPVVEKILVASSFDIRDVLYQHGFAVPYYVVHLSEKSVRLFSGRFQHLKEVSDKQFPVIFEDDYLYNTPVRATSYSGEAVTRQFERDKNTLQTIRLNDFLKTADETLNPYLGQDSLMIVAGTTKDLSLFNKLTKHSRIIVGNMEGNYTHVPLQELATDAWYLVQKFLENKNEKHILEFVESIGYGKGVAGVAAIRKAVHEGRGSRLLIEKDFYGQHQIVPELINELIANVIDMNGQVTVTRNEALKDLGGIALITRY